MRELALSLSLSRSLPLSLSLYLSLFQPSPSLCPSLALSCSGRGERAETLNHKEPYLVRFLLALAGRAPHMSYQD